MAVTRSWEARTPLALDAAKPPVPAARRRELWWMLCASLLVALSLAHAYIAKTQDFPQLREKLDRGELVNLNAIHGADSLMPVLEVIPEADRASVAGQVSAFVERSRPVANVGALARLRSLKDEKARLLPMGVVKPLLVVRTPREYLRAFLIWTIIFFAAFYLVHAVWRWARFRGDPAILPALHLLTGLGLTLMVSLRDPLRDTLEFSKFAWGSALGCLLLLLPLLRAVRLSAVRATGATRRCSPHSHSSACCWRSAPDRRATTPRSTSARSSRWSSIKILLVLFLAGYFTRHWERLRDLREKRLVPASCLARPAAVGACRCRCCARWRSALVMFFVLKDLGPALVTFFVFLAMFAVARGRAGLALAGHRCCMVGGVALGLSHAAQPHTVVDRIHMWLVAVGQRRARRRSAGARAVGIRHRRTTGLRPGLGRPGDDSRRAIPTWCCRRSAKSGASRAWPPSSCCSAFWSGARVPRRAATLGYDFGLFLGVGLGIADRVRDAADLRGRAGRAAAFGRGVAVPELGQHGDAGEFPGVRVCLAIVERAGTRGPRRAEFA